MCDHWTTSFVFNVVMYHISSYVVIYVHGCAIVMMHFKACDKCYMVTGWSKSFNVFNY